MISPSAVVYFIGEETCLVKVETVEIEVNNKIGHRERLKAHFVAGDEEAYTEEKLLELLLTYAIPQKDVQPLARKLISTFGSLSDVLSADITALCKQEGIKEHSAVLLKLIDWIRNQDYSEKNKQAQVKESFTVPTLFSDDSFVTTESDKSRKASPKSPKSTTSRDRSGLFGKSMLQESIDMLPQLPNTELLTDIKEFDTAQYNNGQVLMHT